MRPLLISLLLMVSAGGGNALLRQAREAYAAGQYAQSLRLYQEVQQSYPAAGPQLAYNLGQCYRQLDSVDLALTAYQRAMQGAEPAVGALAANEAGVLLAERAQLQDALATFRQALIWDPAHEDARYNYELVYRRLYPPTPPEETPPPPDAPPPPAEMPEETPPPLADEALQELIDRLQAQSESRRRTNDQAQPPGADTLTPAQARRALERLRQQDLQYLQQLRKRAIVAPRAEKHRDW